MGGFRQDLQKKILGNNPHIVVERSRGSIEGWEPLLQTIKRTRGARTAAAYVSGEVMVTSSSNMAGAVLHGTDPNAIEEVTNLEHTVREGKIEGLTKNPADELPGLIVGRELAHMLRITTGEGVNVVSPLGDFGPAGPMPKSRPFRVVAIFYSGMYEYDLKYMYTTLVNAQRFFGKGGAVTGIEIKV